MMLFLPIIHKYLLNLNVSWITPNNLNVYKKSAFVSNLANIYDHTGLYDKRSNKMILSQDNNRIFIYNVKTLH